MRKYLLFVIMISMLIITGCTGNGGEDVKFRGLFGGGKNTVGEDITSDDITDFYYTEENINYGAYYLRYRFYTEDGKHFFFHERRERVNDYGPCTEDDTVVKGEMELDDAQWDKFFDLISDGKVSARKDSAESGDSGPWYYLYWKDDKSKYQVYSFASDKKESGLTSYCEELAEECSGSIPLSGEPSIELIRIRYSPGYSDMDGEHHSMTIYRDGEGKWVFESYDRSNYEEPAVTTIYEVSDEDIKQLELFIDKSDIEELLNREESDLFITDYSSWGINIQFTDLESGEKTEYRLDEYREYTDYDNKLIDKLIQRITGIKGEMISETVEEDE